MSLDSTTRPSGLTWLPIAILAAGLVIAALGFAVIEHVAPATPAARPVPTLHEYSNAAADTGASAASGGSSAEPDHAVAAATGTSICAETQGCVGSQLLSVFASTGPSGHHEWEATYRFAMRSGPSMTEVVDLDPATGQRLRRVDSWASGQP